MLLSQELNLECWTGKTRSISEFRQEQKNKSLRLIDRFTLQENDTDIVTIQCNECKENLYFSHNATVQGMTDGMVFHICR